LGRDLDHRKTTLFQQRGLVEPSSSQQRKS
jgi:hypothetical protein